MFDVEGRDTICALATPHAPSAIAVIRVSGPRSLEVCKKIFSAKFGVHKPHVATLGNLKNNSGELIDEVLCTLFPGKKSFTGEDSFELSIHGSPIIANETLGVLLGYGCRLAEPGEFTFRAFSNGKLDLTQTEAIESLIHSESIEAKSIALKNLKGSLGNVLTPVRAAIVEALAELEARLDFPDEELGAVDLAPLVNKLENTSCDLQKLLKTANAAKQITSGVRVVLYGPPNAGKSTLLNALVGSDKAIVHHTPGTTRDVLEAKTIISGVLVTLIDVAGIRPEEEAGPVEKIGIERAQNSIKSADLVLNLMAPGLQKTTVPFEGVKVLSVATKSDLNSEKQKNTLEISAKTGAGLDELRQKIAHTLLKTLPTQSEAFLTKERQEKEVLCANTALRESIQQLRFNEFEFATFEIREAGKALDRLLGRTLDEDVLDLIFSKFCIGK